MFERALDAVKGWFHLSALDKSAKLDNTLLVSATVVPAGRVAVLNDVGEFILDRTDASLTAQATAMPIFLWNGSDHPDVYNDGTSPVTSTVHWHGISPTGVMSGLVATGGYELQTTEFDTAQTYAVNQPLTASALGVLTNAGITVYTTWICGICSSHVQGDNQAVDAVQAASPGSPEGLNAHGVSVLTFWTYFLPAS
jgi:hypothetical protein